MAECGMIRLNRPSTIAPVNFLRWARLILNVIMGMMILNSIEWKHHRGGARRRQDRLHMPPLFYLLFPMINLLSLARPCLVRSRFRKTYNP